MILATHRRPGRLRGAAAFTHRLAIASGVWRAALPLVFGVGVWLIPPPAGLPAAAWHYLGIFVAAIAGLITEPVPGPVVGLFAVTVAAALRLVGLTPADSIQWALSGFSRPLFLFVTTFFVAHYLFASLTAHASALLPVFLATAAAIPGMPMRPLALALCYAVGLMGVLTPYATGPAPIYFGSGYISRKDFWRLGSIFGAIFLASLLAVGVPYLLALAP